jgi:hypothetical protein
VFPLRARRANRAPVDRQRRAICTNNVDDDEAVTLSAIAGKPPHWKSIKRITLDSQTTSAMKKTNSARAMNKGFDGGAF